ncbi:TVP38/TMEM64 family protein [Paenibacillus guangzhouensis]|uniref:TVP38/TMEM64 family protein n=1 Tax=Paenibacillus guangzhouensis TaxID=1473112 RepID=UPI0012678115|nr:TVP38/TMEM64 family protein [Paenibacillus guangzhouensis]
MIADILSYISDGNWVELLEKYRSLGPFPGIFLTFMKSFVPPLPTIVLVGGNAAVYGFWLGFLYSWIGLVSGCAVTYLIVAKISGSRFAKRWTSKPKVQRGMRWARQNAFSYVFLLGILPVGPFVAVTVAAAAARMPFRSFLLACGMGKAIMVFMVSYIGYDLKRFMERPIELLYVVLFIVASLWVSKRIEKRFARAEEAIDTTTMPLDSTK